MEKLAAKFTVAGLADDLLNGLFWDEEEDEDYEALSDHVKQNYYVIAKTQDGKFIRFPKGRVAAVIQDAMEEMEHLVTGDDEADFEWERTPFCETVGDADNIDRFDAYRIYETLEYIKFSEMSLDDKREKVASTIEKLTRFKEMKLGTATAKNLWLQRLDYYIGFYEKLKAQLENSTTIK